MCMVACIANIKDNTLLNKLRLEEVLKAMLVGMSESNKDGTGMAFAATDGRVFMNKTAKAGKLVADEFSLDVDIDYKHFILHTRMATHGATNDINAHPHETKHGFMVHNGWCPGLFQKHKEVMKTGCDTEALAYVYSHDPSEFDKNLLGTEHFAIIHLDSDGSNVRVMNKNKMLYRVHSKLLSADIFLTSSTVIKDVGKLIGEDLDYQMVNDGEIFLLDGETIQGSKFKFTDSGYGSWNYYDWEGDYSTSSSRNVRGHNRHWYFEQYQKQKALESRSSGKPVYHNRGKRRDNDIPNFVFGMTRKERKRWIRENKEKRDEYIKFWMAHEDELSKQEAQEKEFRENGFTILDADGNVIDDE